SLGAEAGTRWICKLHGPGRSWADQRSANVSDHAFDESGAEDTRRTAVPTSNPSGFGCNHRKAPPRVSQSSRLGVADGTVSSIDELVVLRVRTTPPLNG